ncbi:hypothetical protein [Actinokineospora cianjurensis]|uniref:Sporulation related protein n=1 Tax=Actinokineospora cianjurensis TaxID=585224 RepID=A0A421BAP5_9PSEU|nr:hypothetical protein [Actinokineospora cianjurensis]RLK61419.1 hypothetical protein CLV68_1959 [Actinokineospora cianjurensis]
MDLPAPYLLLVALVVIGLLGLVLRWAFHTPDPHHDYGLLRQVATAPTRTAAKAVEDQLRHAGVKSTTATTPDGDAYRILVFPADERTAIDVLLGS